MWRAQTSRKGRHLLKAVRQLTTEPAPLPMPKPPPKSNVFRLLKIFGLGVPLAATSVLTYALYNQEFRIQLLNNIPYAKELLGDVLPPPSIPKPEASTSPEKASTIFVQDDAAKETSFQKLSSKIVPELVQQQQNYLSKTMLVQDLLFKDADDYAPVKKDESEQVVQKQIQASVVETPLVKRVDEDKTDNTALEAVIQKLIANSQSLVADAVRAQTEAASSIQNHTKLLKQTLDDVTETHEKDAMWEAVSIAHKEREQALQRASERVTESKKCVEKLQDVIQEGKTNRVTQNNPAISEASRQLNGFLKDLGSVNVQVRQAETEANVIQNYKELVDKGRKLFQQEVESLVPAATPGSGTKWSEGELNTLIAHAYRRIQQLQGQISELQALERQKLTTALKTQVQEYLKVTDASITEERLLLHQEFKDEKYKLEQDYLVRLENEVRKQLARQAAAHNDHLNDALTNQQEALASEFNRALQFRVLEEREKFQMEVTGWISRLKGIETAVDSRAVSEELTRSAQNLWLACIALNSLINFGGDNQHQKQPQPLRTSVEAILQAGNKIPFVQTMATNFPNTALDRGVNTEEELKQRFYKVSRICHRLGLVNTSDASLYQYLISYMHSLVVFDNVVATSETEEVDLNNLDTFTILAHAKYWMDKGNLDLAMRFMIQLNGESRKAASDWITETRLFLETKQIARTLTAFASASGLANTF